MAGEWIKMRTNLWDDPRVSHLCDLVDQPEAMVVGALYWLWSMADEHSEDGVLPGLTLRAIDRKTGVAGIGAALVQIGWLAEVDGGVGVVKFGEHNGTSAKRRCQEAQRKANARNVSASDADKTPPPCGAREEKRRVKPSLTPRDDSQPDSNPKPEDPDAPFAMTLEWQPDPDRLKALVFRAGLSPKACEGALGAFVIYHQAKGLALTAAEWHAKLIAWAKQDQVREAAQGGKVTALRPRNNTPTDDDFASTGWLGEQP
ncbi:DnaT-like ssDNA-binding domain-containing protein [Ectopseudomonas khazarica]|uniref:DnaT-like ssDNA-binding domain-containing protein n=1 Tax=Ectopseudomonas khazarica TaxID=2502979 RepID=UPI003B93B40D